MFEIFKYIPFSRNVMLNLLFRGGSSAAATSKMERFVIIVNGWKPLTIITKRSILDVAAALDPPLRKTIYLTKKILSDGNCIYTRTETRS